jgi:hypothetical protein
MPFPTALLAEFISTDFAKPAIAFYCFGGVVNSLGWNILLHTIYKPRKLVNSESNVILINGIKKSVQIGFIIYTATLILAFWLPIVALVINLLLWIVWISLSVTQNKN